MSTRSKPIRPIEVVLRLPPPLSVTLTPPEALLVTLIPPAPISVELDEFLYVISAEEAERYAGEYEVTSGEDDYVLPTGSKVMTADMVVKKTPTAEVSNTSGGTTFIIGE